MAKKRCFVVMGYGTRLDSSTGKKIDLDRIYQEIIKPVVRRKGYECLRGDEVLDSGLIDESMYYGILESDLVIADISTLNPNAIYELGVRHGVKRFHTIIMMESGDKFFFDLNHNRTLTYTYYYDSDSFDNEAKVIQHKLQSLITSIETNKQVDSPLYKFITNLKEPQQEQATSVGSKGIKPLYERIREATDLRRKERYEEAYRLFEKLSTDVPSDPYFKQQMALCTYKSEKPNLKEALQRAYEILSSISETIDPETNGLLGAIHKRLYYVTKRSEYVDKAILFYKRAYNLFSDNYNGENYAFCLLLKAALVVDIEEKEELRCTAKHIYREIYDTNKSYVEAEINTEYEMWVIASLASCALVLKKEDDFHTYEDLFLSKANKMMKSSYSAQKEKLTELLK